MLSFQKFTAVILFALVYVAVAIADEDQKDYSSMFDSDVSEYGAREPLEKKRFEITPFIGYTVGGDFEDSETEQEFDIDESQNRGFLVSFDYSAYGLIGFYYSGQDTEVEFQDVDGRQSFDLDVDYFHFEGTLLFDRGQFEPFIVGSIGATRFDPDSSFGNSETYLSLGLGGGVRYFVTDNFGLYAMGRGIATFVDSETAIYSGPDGTVILFQSDTLWQVQFNAGLVIRF